MQLRAQKWAGTNQSSITNQLINHLKLYINSHLLLILFYRDILERENATAVDSIVAVLLCMGMFRVDRK